MCFVSSPLISPIALLPPPLPPLSSLSSLLWTPVPSCGARSVRHRLSAHCTPGPNLSLSSRSIFSKTQGPLFGCLSVNHHPSPSKMGFFPGHPIYLSRTIIFSSPKLGPSSHFCPWHLPLSLKCLLSLECSSESPFLSSSVLMP